MNSPFRRILAAIATAVVVAGAITGLVALDRDAVSYEARFVDAAELVPKNDVRINDVVVGAVTDIRLDGFTAVVSFTVERGVRLPGGTRATIRQASLLGDRFLDLAPEGEGTLEPGAAIPADRTRRAHGLEAVVGGGAKLAGAVGSDSINRILYAADEAVVEQREETERLIDNAGEAADAFAGAGDDLEAAIEGVEKMADSLEPTTEELGGSVERLADGFDVLARHDDEMAAFASSLSSFSTELSGVLEANRDHLMTFGGKLRQVLGEVVRSRDAIDRGIASLYDFNAAWGCIGDGNFINQTFVLLPEAATIDYGPGHCDPMGGTASRDMRGQIIIEGTGRPVPQEWQEGANEEETGSGGEDRDGEQEGRGGEGGG